MYVINRETIKQEIKNFDKVIQKIICVKFSVACAEKCLILWTLTYPNDQRPLEAIMAAKKWIEKPSEENRKNASKAAINVVYSTIYVTNRYIVNVAHSAWAAAETAHSIYPIDYVVEAIDEAATACNSIISTSGSRDHYGDICITNEWLAQTLNEIIQEYSATLSF